MKMIMIMIMIHIYIYIYIHMWHMCIHAHTRASLVPVTLDSNLVSPLFEQLPGAGWIDDPVAGVWQVLFLSFSAVCRFIPNWHLRQPFAGSTWGHRTERLAQVLRPGAAPCEAALECRLKRRGFVLPQASARALREKLRAPSSQISSPLFSHPVVASRPAGRPASQPASQPSDTTPPPAWHRSEPSAYSLRAASPAKEQTLSNSRLRSETSSICLPDQL